MPRKDLNVALSPERRFFGLFKRRPIIYLDGVHDFLSDDADWNAPFWSFEPQGAQLLADFLLKFSEAYKKEFIFSAIWAGDDAGPDTKQQTVGEAGIIEAARSNQIGTKTFYKVVRA